MIFHLKFKSLTERNKYSELCCVSQGYLLFDVVHLVGYEPHLCCTEPESTVEEAVSGWEAKVGSGLSESHT